MWGHDRGHTEDDFSSTSAHECGPVPGTVRSAGEDRICRCERGVDTVGDVAEFSKGKEIPSGEAGVQDEDLGGLLKVYVLSHGRARVGS